jgi:asparagine synthase (glutamine-hydrolysing)
LRGESLIRELDLVANRAVESCLAPNGFVLYSGGIDSTILATLVEKKVQPKSWGLFTLGVRGSKDTTNYFGEGNSVQIFSAFRKIVCEIAEDRVTLAAKKIVKMADFLSISHFEDCTAFYLISEEIKKLPEGNESILLSANGPDELFCGYDRFRRILDTDGYRAAELEIDQALNSANNLRAQVKLIATSFGLKILEPFFQAQFVDFCWKKIPIELKILKNNDLLRKRIWRSYGKYLGIPNDIATRPKKAMQYSMGLHKIIVSLVKTGEISFARIKKA